MGDEDTTIVNRILDAEDGRIGDDGIGEDGVEGQETGGDNAEYTSVADVVNEDVLNASCEITSAKQTNPEPCCKAASSPRRR